MHDDDTIEAVTLGCFRPPSDALEARTLKAWSTAAPADRPAGATEAVMAALGIAPAERAARAAAARERAVRALERATRAGLTALPWTDRRYPPLLRELPDPPIVLWIKGQWDALHLPAVAIVGARHATPTGVRVAEEIAAGLASAGLSIVSGLARGVDGAAHRGALRTTGRTVAVLGCGADLIYPAEHQALAATITAAGVIVSELPPGARPLAHHFPLRNRIVSGLSRAVVVIEASEKSGSLITARLALEQGRDVLAVPGNVLSGVSAGCHRLIKDGARLVENVRDVLEELGWAPAPGHGGTDVNKPIRMSELERQMAAGESYNLDELTAHDPARAADVLAELTRLELAGRVRRLPGGHFVRMGG